ALAAVLEAEVLDGVGEVDVRAVDARRLEGVGEHPPGRPDEGLALPVLPVARLLADEHEPGPGVPRGEDHLGGTGPQLAAPAAGRRRAQGADVTVRGHPLLGAGSLHGHGLTVGSGVPRRAPTPPCGARTVVPCAASPPWSSSCSSCSRSPARWSTAWPWPAPRTGSSWRRARSSRSPRTPRSRSTASPSSPRCWQGGSPRSA